MNLDDVAKHVAELIGDKIDGSAPEEFIAEEIKRVARAFAFEVGRQFVFAYGPAVCFRSGPGMLPMMVLPITKPEKNKTPEQCAAFQVYDAIQDAIKESEEGKHDGANCLKGQIVITSSGAGGSGEGH